MLRCKQFYFEEIFCFWWKTYKHVSHFVMNNLAMIFYFHIAHNGALQLKKWLPRLELLLCKAETSQNDMSTRLLINLICLMSHSSWWLLLLQSESFFIDIFSGNSFTMIESILRNVLTLAMHIVGNKSTVCCQMWQLLNWIKFHSTWEEFDGSVGGFVCVFWNWEII